MTTLRIYVACLASYNNGTLYGRHIDAAQDADAIKEEIAELLRGSKYPNVQVDCPMCGGAGCFNDDKDAPCLDCKETGKVPSAEEYAIHDHEGFEGIKIGENESIEKVATLATLIEEHGEAFVAFYNNGSVDCDDDAKAWGEAFQEAYLGTHCSVEDYAESLADDVGLLSEMPENLRCYFDFERYARDMVLGGDIWVTDGGDGVLVFSNV